MEPRVASKSSEPARVNAGAPNGRSKLRTILAGAAAYLLLAVLAKLWVVGAPLGNPYLHVVVLAFLGLAFLVTVESILAAAGVIPADDTGGWPLCAAAVGCVAYSLTYGRGVFITYWFNDDWGFLVPRPFNMGLLTAPLGDHFVPLLNIVLWMMERLFGLDYIGAACLQQAASLLLILASAHLLWSAARRPAFIALSTGLWGMWPSFGIARTWLAGGFWLTASAALLAVYVLHFRNTVGRGGLRLRDAAVSLLLASATVFISSQTLIPVVYLIALCVSPVLLRPRNVNWRAAATLCSLSLIPTILAFWGRGVYLTAAPLNWAGFSGLQVLANAGAFILTKVFFVNVREFNSGEFKTSHGWLSVITFLVLVVLPLAAAFWKVVRSRADAEKGGFAMAGLMAAGCAAFLVALAQVGLGRRWTAEALVSEHYVTLPLFGLYLIWSGIALTLFPRRARRVFARPWHAVSVAASIVFAAAGASLYAAVPMSSVLAVGSPPIAQRLRAIHWQRRIMNDFTAAVCELAALHPSGVVWKPPYDLGNCVLCERTIAPWDNRRGEGSFAGFGAIAAKGCPEAHRKRVQLFGAGPVTTDGSESKAASYFIRTYLSPLDAATLPQEIARARVERRGAATLDSINGAGAVVENGGFTFVIQDGTIKGCYGSAFDDQTNTAPVDVWLELTHLADRKKYYWPLDRMPWPMGGLTWRLSTNQLGLQCQPASYRLPPGRYSAAVYQIDGALAIASEVRAHLPITVAVK